MFLCMQSRTNGGPGFSPPPHLPLVVVAWDVAGHPAEGSSTAAGPAEAAEAAVNADTASPQQQLGSLAEAQQWCSQRGGVPHLTICGVQVRSLCWWMGWAAGVGWLVPWHSLFLAVKPVASIRRADGPDRSTNPAAVPHTLLGCRTRAACRPPFRRC